MDPVIATRALTKHYRHTSRGITDLDLDVRAGEVFGFLGPNGAGKTTTIRVLLDLIRPTSGEARIFGLDVHRDREHVHRRIGYVPGDLSLFDRLTGRENLRAFAAMAGTVTDSRVAMLAERLELDLDVAVSALSRGNRQKVGLIQAFARDGELLVLDEPTAGLDPIMQQRFTELVREATQHGRTVFLSSHQLDEVQRLADRVGIVRDSRLVVVEDVGVLRARAVRRIELHFAGMVSPDEFAALPGVAVLETSGDRLRLAVEGSIDSVIKAAARHEIIDLSTHEADLEEIFLPYYREPAGSAS